MSYLQVSGGDVVPCDNRLLQRDDFVRTEVRVEVRLQFGEEHNRAVGTSASELTAGFRRGRERDGVVEREAQRLMSLLRTLVVEEVVHDVVPDGEEGAARRVRCGVLAVGARNASRERS